MEDSYKEVYFDKYCKTCQYEDKKEDDNPCYDCLSNPVNLYSHKPTEWKEKQNDRKRVSKRSAENVKSDTPEQ